MSKLEYEDFIRITTAKFVGEILGQQAEDVVLKNADDYFYRHMQLGLYVRNKYNLWNCEFVNEHHPDDMSAQIIARAIAFFKGEINIYD